MIFLKKYKEIFEKELKKVFDSMGEETKLKEACRYAFSKGKRFRPILVMLVSDAIGKNYNVIPSCIAVELFHTASLIADDLPCMDDEDKRRNKKVVHKVFGEDISILASYTFIAMGYEMIVKNGVFLQEHISKEQSDDICVLAVKEMSEVAGIFGATNGQFLDLYPPNNSLQTILKIMIQKTANLFALSFSLGWLFGGGDKKKLDVVKKAGKHFGMAFQIADDIKDAKKDNSLNITNLLGKKQSLQMFFKEIDQFSEILKNLNIFNTSFQSIISQLKKSI